MEDLKNLHHWNVLAVSCIDGRFVRRINDWIVEQEGNIFDYRTEVGCSKAIIDSPEDRERLFNVIEVAIRLHSIKEIWLIDHIDCGAYGGSKEYGDVETEKQFHIEKLNEAAKIVGEKFPQLSVRKIYASWDTITQYE